jgi:hypothetical protein
MALIMAEAHGKSLNQPAEDVLMLVYEQDKGEKMWDISAPVTVQGRPRGEFRIGYYM